MKFARLAIVVLLVAFGARAYSQEVSLVPYITVAGYAEDWVDPDIAVWNISINQTGKDLIELKATNDREYNRAISVAESLGVVPEHIISGRISVRKVYKKDNHGRSTGEFSHFVVSRIVKVEQHDMAQFDAFLDKLLLSSELNVRLEYKLSTAESVQWKLRLQAVQAARDKAAAMAEVLHATVGAPLIISEFPIISDYQQFDHLSRQAGVMSRATPERIKVSQRVYIRFELGPPIGARQRVPNR